MLKPTSSWYDNWHPLDPFADKFGPRVTAIPNDALMSFEIRNGFLLGRPHFVTPYLSKPTSCQTLPT